MLQKCVGMRVGIIAPPWLPIPAPGCGAIEEIIDDLAVHLTAAGNHVTVATTGDSTVPVSRVSTFPEARSDAVDRSSIETARPAPPTTPSALQRGA